jgi:heme exporter protein D
MNWTSLADFLHMGGYGLYVWGSLGVTLACLATEVVALRLRQNRLCRQAALSVTPPRSNETQT